MLTEGVGTTRCDRPLGKGHFTHEPRALTMRVWEPKRKCPKAALRHLQSHVMWSQTCKCSVKTYVTGSSTKCYFNECHIMRVLIHDDKLNQWLCVFGVLWSHGFVLGLPPRGGFWKSSKWPWHMIHSIPCRNPCILYIHRTFTYFVGPSSEVWSELGPVLPFPPMRVLGV